MRKLLLIILTVSILGNVYLGFQEYWDDLYKKHTDPYYDYYMEPPFGMSGEGWIEFCDRYPAVAGELTIQELTGMKPLNLNDLQKYTRGE